LIAGNKSPRNSKSANHGESIAARLSSLYVEMVDFKDLAEAEKWGARM
jgi:hypothetical protein